MGESLNSKIMSHEHRAGGELIYSKLATGQFLDERNMVKEIGKRLKKAA